MDEDSIKFDFLCDCSDFEIPGTLKIYCERHPQYAEWFKSTAIEEAQERVAKQQRREATERIARCKLKLARRYRERIRSSSIAT